MGFYFIAGWIILGFFNAWYRFEEDDIQEQTRFLTRNTVLTVYVIMHVVMSPYFFIVDTMPCLVKDLKIYIKIWLIKRKVNKE